MDKKGYIKTLEAVIAIVIILIFTFAVTPKPAPSYRLPSSVENAQTYILEEIQRNETIRRLVMGGEPTADVYDAIKGIVASNMPVGHAYTIGICKESACASNLTPIAEERSIYTAEAMIASDGAAGTPRIVRIWMWQA